MKLSTWISEMEKWWKSRGMYLVKMVIWLHLLMLKVVSRCALMRRSQNLTDIVLMVGVPGDQVSVSGSGAHKSVIKSCIELCLICLSYGLIWVIFWATQVYFCWNPKPNTVSWGTRNPRAKPRGDSSALVLSRRLWRPGASPVDAPQTHLGFSSPTSQPPTSRWLGLTVSGHNQRCQ